MAVIIKTFCKSDYKVELRAVENHFEVIFLSRAGDGDRFRDIRKSTTATKQAANNAFYRYKKEIENRVIDY